MLIVAAGTSEIDRLERALQDAGCELSASGRLVEAEHLLRFGRYDALIFDVALVGSHFLPRVLREHSAKAFVAWLSRSSSMRVAELFEAGADEVLDGTMAEGELVARVRNATRHGRRPSKRTIELGALRIATDSEESTWNGLPLALTRREQAVLQILAEAGGESVRREVLYRRVWGYTMVRGDRSVDVNVKRLRDKLAQTGAELNIRTTPRVGYRLELPTVPLAEDAVVTAS
jgi:DNA-binding response OmpR family regulator